MSTVSRIAFYRKYVYLAFITFNLSLLAIVLLSFFLLSSGHPLSLLISSLATLPGKAAVLTFFLTLTPGIAGRFNARNQFTGLLMLFRRQLGVTTFMLSFTHYSLTRLIPILARVIPLTFPLPLFELFGTISLLLLFPLFLTSHNLAVKKLGRHWHTLHKLVYIIAWTLFGHLALQRFSLYSLLVGFLAILETTSLIYSRFRPRNPR